MTFQVILTFFCYYYIVIYFALALQSLYDSEHDVTFLSFGVNSYDHQMHLNIIIEHVMFVLYHQKIVYASFNNIIYFERHLYVLNLGLQH